MTLLRLRQQAQQQKEFLTEFAHLALQVVLNPHFA